MAHLIMIPLFPGPLWSPQQFGSPSLMSILPLIFEHVVLQGFPLLPPLPSNRYILLVFVILFFVTPFAKSTCCLQLLSSTLTRFRNCFSRAESSFPTVPLTSRGRFLTLLFSLKLPPHTQFWLRAGEFLYTIFPLFAEDQVLSESPF